MLLERKQGEFLMRDFLFVGELFRGSERARFLKHIGRSIRWGTEIEANRASRVADICIDCLRCASNRIYLS